MLTKSDLKAIGQLVKTAIKEVSITKEEAKRFATKDDLKGFASKKDLVGLARGVEIVDLKFTFIDKLSQWKDELFTKIDNFMKEIKAAREE